MANHLDILIRPHAASVFVVTDVNNWCHAPLEAQAALINSSAAGFRLAASLFQEEVRRVFEGWDDVHARLLPEDNPKMVYRATMTVPNIEFPSASKAMLASHQTRLARSLIPHMTRWYFQYEHLALANAFRRARSGHQHHAIIVRARLDTLLTGDQNMTLALNLSEPRFRNDSLVHAPAYRAVNYDGFNERPCRPNDPPVPTNDPLHELHHCSLKFEDLLLWVLRAIRTVQTMYSTTIGADIGNTEWEVDGMLMVSVRTGGEAVVHRRVPWKVVWLVSALRVGTATDRSDMQCSLRSVGTPVGFKALATMSGRPLEYSGSAPLMRCHAWCEEEQTLLQLAP